MLTMHPTFLARLPLPPFLVDRLDAAADALLQPADRPRMSFLQPPGEPALIAADSYSWRLFKNPLALFIGGVTAVILELAEPSVRTGVWEHSSFRSDAVGRLQRTGLAAMITIYGARSQAEAMIERVVSLHGHVTGRTPGGTHYEANDVDLLNWVQATASFGFIEAYDRYVRRLSVDDFDRLYAEALPAARLYGAIGAPQSRAEQRDLMDRMGERLEPSPIIFEFLEIMRNAAIFPAPLRGFQRMLIRAAVDLVPDELRTKLGLTRSDGLRAGERPLIRLAAWVIDRIVLPNSPAVQACRRMSLPDDYLFRRIVETPKV